MLDERLQKIQTEKQNALNQSNNLYQGLLNNNQELYNSQLQHSNEAERIQNSILDKQLTNQTEKIEQQKQEAQKSYDTEAKKARNDYTSFVNPYGYNAEAMASQGLNNSGVLETSKLGGWNTYQNRLANANKVKEAAILQYNQDMKDARLNYDVQKAQNAYQKLQAQLGFVDNYYTNKGNIEQNQLSSNQNLDSEYYNRYQTEYANIQNEKQRQEAIRQWEAEMQEQQRQYNENMAFQRQQAQQSQSNWEKEYALSKKKVNSSSSSSRSSGSGGYALSSGVKNPYTGTIHKDTKYGTFSNGYQPDNVSGSKLSNSGLKVSNVFANSATGSTGISLSNQSIWTANGRYYIWDGSQDDYIDVTSQVNYVKNGGYGPMKW